MEKIIIREKYLEKIRPFYDSKYIKVITGVRRCGKTELLFQIINEIKGSGVNEKNIIVLRTKTEEQSRCKRIYKK